MSLEAGFEPQLERNGFWPRPARLACPLIGSGAREPTFRATSAALFRDGGFVEREVRPAASSEEPSTQLVSTCACGDVGACIVTYWEIGFGICRSALLG